MQWHEKRRAIRRPLSRPIDKGDPLAGFLAQGLGPGGPHEAGEEGWQKAGLMPIYNLVCVFDPEGNHDSRAIHFIGSGGSDFAVENGSNADRPSPHFAGDFGKCDIHDLLQQ